MPDLRRPKPALPADLERLAGWFPVAWIAVYIVGTTWWRTGPVEGRIGFLPIWTIVAAVSLAVAEYLAARGGARHLRPVEASFILAAPGLILTDFSMAYQPLRDLGIYLKAGHHFLAASPVYLQVALHSRPADLSNYPFLYPPLTLPFFAALAMLPEIAVQATWVAGSIGLALVAMRTIGLKWRWACLALLWPPLFQGILVGNVSVPALALLAIAPRLGGGLVVAAVFKLYTGIAALWLVRSRRWLDLAAGIGVVLLVGLVTLPVTHIEAWRQWLDALRLYQVSQQNLDLLYGFGLARFVPLWIFLLLAVAAVLAALAASGKEGLARISSATIVASPSLWGHGLLVAVPSMLYLRPAWFWLGVAITSVPDGVQWWWLPALIVASWFIPALRRQPVEPAVQPRSDPMDPMADGASEPWPGIPVESAGPAWNFKIGRPGRVRPSGSVSEPE